MSSEIGAWIDTYFAVPRMLWVLAIALPLLGLFLWTAWHRRQRLIREFVQSRLLAALTVGVSKTVQKSRLVLVALAVGLLLLALARPRWGFTWEEAKQQGLDIVVAIDTSRSMLAEDLAPNRLTRAKLAALDLMRMAKNDRLGLVAFAGTAFLQCPLTLDEAAFRQSLDALDVGIIPQGGSALGAAIKVASTAFTGDEDNHRVLVILSDGEDHESGAVEAAEQAADATGLRIFTVGVGTPNGEVLRQRDEAGALAYIKDAEGNVVKSRLNEALLTQLSTVARGFYLPLSGANTIQVLFERGLAPLPKTELSSRLIKRYNEQYYWFVAVAILCLLAEMFLSERKRVSRPEPALAAGSNADLGKAVAALIAASLCLNLHASPAKALKQFERGNYPEAKRQFEALLAETPDDARLRYNAGAAAYQAGDFADAADHFSSTLAAPDLDLQQRAYYNLGNALYRLGQRQENLDQKKQAWTQAVRQFEGALKLDPQDADAKHNLEWVQNQIDALPKPPEQPQEPEPDEGDKKDEDKPDQEKSSQQQDQGERKEDKGSEQQDQKREEPQPANQPQNEQDQKQNQERQDQQPKPEEKQGSQNKDKPAPEPPKESPSPPGQTNNAAGAMGQMTPEQVKRLLDAQQNEEKAMLFLPKEKPDRPARLIRDW